MAYFHYFWKKKKKKKFFVVDVTHTDPFLHKLGKKNDN